MSPRIFTEKEEDEEEIRGRTRKSREEKRDLNENVVCAGMCVQSSVRPPARTLTLSLQTYELPMFSNGYMYEILLPFHLCNYTGIHHTSSNRRYCLKISLSLSRYMCVSSNNTIYGHEIALFVHTCILHRSGIV